MSRNHDPRRFRDDRERYIQQSNNISQRFKSPSMTSHHSVHSFARRSYFRRKYRQPSHHVRSRFARYLDQYSNGSNRYLSPHRHVTLQQATHRRPTYRHHPSNPGDTGQSPFKRLDKDKKSLEDSENLKSLSLSQDIFDPPTEDTCSICLDEMVDKNRQNWSHKTILNLRCDHRFHKSCVTEWLDRKKTCPICRTQVKTWEYETSCSASNDNIYNSHIFYLSD